MPNIIYKMAHDEGYTSKFGVLHSERSPALFDYIPVQRESPLPSVALALVYTEEDLKLAIEDWRHAKAKEKSNG